MAENDLDARQLRRLYTDSLCAFGIALAKRGDPEAARWLVEFAAFLLERGSTLPPPLRDFIVAGLRAKSVDRALRLIRGKGQRTLDMHWSFQLAVTVERIRAEQRVPLRDNRYKAGAYSRAVEAANKNGLQSPPGRTVTPDVVEKHWKRWRRLFKSRPDLALAKNPPAEILPDIFRGT